MNVVIGRTPPGRFPPTWPSPFTKSSSICVKIEDEVLILAKRPPDYCLDAFGWKGKPMRSYEFPGRK